MGEDFFSLLAAAPDHVRERAALERGKALADIERRIDAIAQVHRSLYATDDVESIDVKDYLQALVDELGGAWASEKPRRAVAGGGVDPPSRAITIRAVSGCRP